MNRKIIVSLTSIPERIERATPLVIKSILSQSVQPDKIVLYLAIEQFPDKILPKALTDLVGEKFQIKFCNDIRSYKKIIPALHDFPDAIIITVDDDIVYPKHLLKKMLHTHKKYPNAIIGRRVKKIKLDAKSEIMPYKSWKVYRGLRYLLWGTKPSYTNFNTGCGGVLYPPHSLHPDVVKSEVFMEIAPTADDVWLWGMAVLNKTKIAPVPFGYLHGRGIRGSKEKTLLSINKVNNRNVLFMQDMIKKYPAIRISLTDID
ncbi:hypothetical protein FACS189421_04420 [Bacteroidia bacterium]|nr:hypothetical protein FACS189421_04420 [Bacteroidia bacterium]GHT50933.1 hypothetical protein FACS189440_19200 [Bacteroidia bacterium]